MKVLHDAFSIKNELMLRSLQDKGKESITSTSVHCIIIKMLLKVTHSPMRFVWPVSLSFCGIR